MKTFLKISLIALGLGAGALPALQAADTSVDRPDRHPRLRALLKHRADLRAKVARRMDLSPEQRTQLKAERAKTLDALKALRADSSLTREQKKAKARELLETARSEVRSALTPEQKAKIDQFRADRKAKRTGRV